MMHKYLSVTFCCDPSSGEVFRRFEVEANTNEISFHPEDNNVFIVAESSFGAVTQFDFRTPTGNSKLQDSDYGTRNKDCCLMATCNWLKIYLRSGNY